MTQVIVNPDADPESTSVDGDAEHAGTNLTWTTLRGGAGTGVGSVDSNATHQAPYVQASGVTDRWSRGRRLFTLFDTSSIPAGATITSATLELYVTSKAGAAVSHVVIATSPASNTAIVAGDYDGVTLTAISDTIASSAITTTAYNTWTLSDLTKITKGGITKIGLALLEDVNDSAPSWSSGQETYIVVQSADGANAPKLTVDYSVGGVLGTAIFFT